MSKRERMITYVFYPQGPDGPAEYEDDVGWTTDENVIRQWNDEVERHTWLYLAEQRGEPVPGRPSAHAVNLSGLGKHPYKRAANIPAEAVGVLARLDEIEVEARVHSIRTARGRLLRKKGWARREADETGRALAAMRPEKGRDTGPRPSSVPLSRGDWEPVRPRLVVPQARIHVPASPTP